jgi:uncharacterized protein YqeY
LNVSLKDTLLNDQLEATRHKDATCVSTLRMVRAAINNAEIEQGHPLDDAGVLDVIARDVKRHRDSIADFDKGNRPDLSQKEEAELAILLSYLPQQMSVQEIEARARAAIAQVGAKGPSDMGKVMGVLMPQLKGKADSRMISQVVQSLLANPT